MTEWIPVLAYNIHERFTDVLCSPGLITERTILALAYEENCDCYKWYNGEQVRADLRRKNIIILHDDVNNTIVKGLLSNLFHILLFSLASRGSRTGTSMVKTMSLWGLWPTCRQMALMAAGSHSGATKNATTSAASLQVGGLQLYIKLYLHFIPIIDLVVSTARVNGHNVLHVTASENK